MLPLNLLLVAPVVKVWKSLVIFTKTDLWTKIFIKCALFSMTIPHQPYTAEGQKQITVWNTVYLNNFSTEINFLTIFYPINDIWQMYVNLCIDLEEHTCSGTTCIALRPCTQLSCQDILKKPICFETCQNQTENKRIWALKAGDRRRGICYTRSLYINLQTGDRRSVRCLSNYDKKPRR